MHKKMGSEGFAYRDTKVSMRTIDLKKIKGYSLMVEHLPSMNEVLGSITSIKEKKSRHGTYIQS